VSEVGLVVKEPRLQSFLSLYFALYLALPVLVLLIWLTRSGESDFSHYNL
jgi:hypothetical protein